MVTRWLPADFLKAFMRRSDVRPCSLKMRPVGAGIAGHGKQEVLDGNEVVL